MKNIHESKTNCQHNYFGHVFPKGTCLAFNRIKEINCIDRSAALPTCFTYTSMESHAMKLPALSFCSDVNVRGALEVSSY